MKQGVLKKIENKKRKSAANKNYWAVHCEEEGETTTLLLTKHDLEEAKQRADANQEDIPPRAKINLFARLFGR